MTQAPTSSALKPLPSGVLAFDLLTPMMFGISDKKNGDGSKLIVDDYELPNTVQEAIDESYLALYAVAPQDETQEPLRWLKAIRHLSLGKLYDKLANQQATALGTVSGRTGQTNIPLGSPEAIRAVGKNHYAKAEALYPELDTETPSFSGGMIKLRRTYRG